MMPDLTDALLDSWEIISTSLAIFFLTPVAICLRRLALALERRLVVHGNQQRNQDLRSLGNTPNAPARSAKPHPDASGVLSGSPNMTKSARDKTHRQQDRFDDDDEDDDSDAASFLTPSLPDHLRGRLLDKEQRRALWKEMGITTGKTFLSWGNVSLGGTQVNGPTLEVDSGEAQSAQTWIESDPAKAVLYVNNIQLGKGDQM
jgi:hypothetical protein